MMKYFSGKTTMLLVFILTSIPIYVMAQPGFDPGVPDGAPIDGGLSMLAIAGVSYAAKKIYNKRKNTEDISDN